MRNVLILLVLWTTLGTIMASSANLSDMIIVKDGEANATIVILLLAFEVIISTVRDLQYYLQKMSVVRLEIANSADNRILMWNGLGEIRSMVQAMVETGRMSGAYMMCIGSHIAFNVPTEATKLYLDLSTELAYR